MKIIISLALFLSIWNAAEAADEFVATLDRKKCFQGEPLFIVLNGVEEISEVKVEVFHAKSGWNSLDGAHFFARGWDGVDGEKSVALPIYQAQGDSVRLLSEEGKYKIRVTVNDITKELEFFMEKLPEEDLKVFKDYASENLFVLLSDQGQTPIDSKKLQSKYEQLLKAHPNSRLGKYVRGQIAIERFLENFQEYFGKEDDKLEKEVCTDLEAAMTLEGESLFKARILFFLAYAYGVGGKRDIAKEKLTRLLKEYENSGWAVEGKKMLDEFSRSRKQ